MSTTYTPDNTNNPTSYQIPEDGDLADVASILAICEGLADKAEHIIGGATEFAGNKTYGGAQLDFQTDIEVNFPSDASFSFTGSRPVINIDDNAETRVLGFGWTSSGLWFPISSNIAINTEHYFELDLPHQANLNDVCVRINPVDDTLPTTKVRLRLTRVQRLTGTSTVIATVEDPATGASYQAEHTFAATFDVLIDKDYKYFVTLIGESGGDEDVVPMLGPPWVTYDIGPLDLGR